MSLFYRFREKVATITRCLQYSVSAIDRFDCGSFQVERFLCLDVIKTRSMNFRLVPFW